MATASGRRLDGRGRCAVTGKYHNVVTERDGYTFASKAEANDYTTLTLLETAGAIRNLKPHPHFVLQEKFTDVSGVKHRAIEYVADFSFEECDTGKLVVVDSKGVETAVFKIKQKLFLYRYPQYELQVWKVRKR